MPPPEVVFALTGDVRRNSRALRQLGALKELGCTVDVLTFGPEQTGRPGSPSDPDAPTGGDVRFRTLPKPPGGGPRFFLRVHRRFRQAALRIPARVYHASDLYVLPAMQAAARHHGGRLAYDARELYPHVGATAGRPWARLFWYAVEGLHVRRADAVFTVGERIAEELVRLYGIRPPTVVYNTPPMQRVARSRWLHEQTGLPPETPLVLYQGYLKRGRGCERLVEAMPQVEGAALVFLGEGPLQPELEARVRRLGLGRRVRFLPMVPPGELLRASASADVGACLIEGITRSLRLSLPNKLFEYLMAGVPVLASDLPEIRRVVAGHGVGRLVDWRDGDAIVEALREMTGRPDKRARWASRVPGVFETFSWEAASDRLQGVYRDLLTAPARS